MKKLIFNILIFTFLLSGTLEARNYYGTPHQVAQPGGDTVTVYLYGSEFYIEAESEDHYTLVKDSSSSEICYAMLSKDGNEYVSSGIVYKGGATPEEVKMIITPHVRINKESRNKKIAETKKKLNKPDSISGSPVLRAAQATSDTVYGLCLLIDFKDVKSNVTVDQVETFLNGDNNPIFGNKSSIKEYFQWISNGKLTYINFVPEQYYTANGNREDYAPRNATDYTIDRFYPEIEAAINQWAEKNPDKFAKLTVNQYGGIRAINILYAGKCPNEWATGLWPHQSYLGINQIYIKNWNQSTPWYLQNQIYHGYQISDIDSKLTMGTFVHENGHLICEWPDFYQYEEHEPANNASEYNIGDAFYISSETNPSYPNPWALDQMGWLDDTKIDITDIKDGRLITLEKGCGNVAVYRGQGKNNKEKYYLEIRDKHYYKNKTNNETGIFIWHSYDDGSNLEPGYDELLDCRPAQLKHPFWTKTSGPAIFNDESDPSGKWRDGANSGVYIWDFSEGGDVMTFRCGEYIENPEFITLKVGNALANIPYSDSIYIQGGDAPYVFSVYDGALPTGLELTKDCVIEGIPTEEGEATFTIEVTDSNGKKAYQEYSITVYKAYPLYGEPFDIPGSFQAEDYDLGGNGVAYSTYRSADVNKVRDAREDQQYFPMAQISDGNYATEFAEDGEWTQYSINVLKSGLYDITIQNSTKNDAYIYILIDYTQSDTMKIPGASTSNNFWSSTATMKNTVKEMPLEEGLHDFKIIAAYTPSKLRIDSLSFQLKPQSDPSIVENEQESQTIILQNTKDGFCVYGIHKGDFIYVYTPQSELVEQIKCVSDIQYFGESYKKGVYIVKIVTENSSSTHKVIKE